MNMIRPSVALLAAAGVLPSTHGHAQLDAVSTTRGIEVPTVPSSFMGRRSLLGKEYFLKYFNSYMAKYRDEEGEEMTSDDESPAVEATSEEPEEDSGAAEDGEMEDSETDNEYVADDGDETGMVDGEMVDESNSATTTAPPPGDCVPPSTIPEVADALQYCKVQAPTAGGEQFTQLDGFCNEYFFAKDGYMRFVTDEQRSELRCPPDTDEMDGFIVQEATASFKATVRLPPKIEDKDNYTWMQVHGDDTSWIRLAHYGEKEGNMNHIWLFIKEGSTDNSDLTSISMGPVPVADFEAGIILPGDGTVEIYAAEFSQTFNINWTDKKNYFKGGSYVQDGAPTNFPVDYKALTYTLESGQMKEGEPEATMTGEETDLQEETPAVEATSEEPAEDSGAEEDGTMEESGPDSEDMSADEHDTGMMDGEMDGEMGDEMDGEMDGEMGGEMVDESVPPPSTPPPPGDCVPPSTIPEVADALQYCKVQAPTAGGEQFTQLDGFCNEYFFSQDGYMRFVTDEQRSELRCPPDTDEMDGFIVQEATASFEATVRLPLKIGDKDNYTWMQVHGDDTSWIRLAHYGDKEGNINHIWLFIKEGSTTSPKLTSISMGPVPVGDFEAGIVLPGDGTVEIYAAEFSQTFDIKWTDKKNYFKGGSYVQDGTPTNFPVDYKALTYTLESGEHFL